MEGTIDWSMPHIIKTSTELNSLIQFLKAKYGDKKLSLGSVPYFKVSIFSLLVGSGLSTAVNYIAALGSQTREGWNTFKY